MLVHYISDNIAQGEYGPAALYAFALRWLFFSIAAPTSDGFHRADPSVNYGGDFEPVLASYFTSPVSAGLVVLFGAMIVASVLPRYRTELSSSATAILPALLAYALFRGVFFGVLNPRECLLFSSSATLTHMLMLGIPFAASSFPAKGVLLAGFGVLLFIVNGTFIIGQ
jgi:hypothetical protein